MPQILIGKDDAGNPTGQYMVGQGGPIVNSLAEAQALGGYLQAPSSGGSSSHGETTGNDWLKIGGAIVGIFILLMVIGGALTNKKLERRGYVWNGQDYEYSGGHNQQPAPTVRYQQPAVYQRPVYQEEQAYPEARGYYQQPNYRQVAPSRRQRQVPPGCYYVVASGQTYCPPKE